MARIDGEIVIDRPVEDVFDFVADERNEPIYNPRMVRVELVSGEPIGPGSKFRAVTKSMGRTVEMFIEFTGYQRPSWLASTTHMASTKIRGSLTFEPVPDGTRMRWSWNVEQSGVFGLLNPIVARIGQHQEETIWANLKRYLETS